MIHLFKKAKNIHLILFFNIQIDAHSIGVTIVNQAFQRFLINQIQLDVKMYKAVVRDTTIIGRSKLYTFTSKVCSTSFLFICCQ